MLNRALCTFSGKIGFYMARAVDTVGQNLGFDEKTIGLARDLVGHGAAIVVAVAGAPEAAVSILSSTAAMPYNPIDPEEMKPNTPAAD